MDAIATPHVFGIKPVAPLWLRLEEAEKPTNCFSVPRTAVVPGFKVTWDAGRHQWTLILDDRWVAILPDACTTCLVDEYDTVYRAAVVMVGGQGHVPMLRRPAQHRPHFALVHIIVGEREPGGFWSGVVADNIVREGRGTALVDLRPGKRIFVFYPDGAVAEVEHADLLGDQPITAPKILSIPETIKCRLLLTQNELSHLEDGVEMDEKRKRAWLYELAKLILLAKGSPSTVDEIMALVAEIAQQGALASGTARAIRRSLDSVGHTRAYRFIDVDDFAVADALCRAPIKRYKHPPFRMRGRHSEHHRGP